MMLSAGIGAERGAAETLSEAVRAAYQTNPGLLERRADQRALDETYVQARAGWRPTLGAQVTLSDERQDVGRGLGSEVLTNATGALVPVGGGAGYTYNSTNATLQASQPLYTGGRVRSAVDAAEADVMAGREDLRAAEVRLLQDVVQAYADVRQDLEVVAVRRDDLQVLERQVEQARARLELGQATRIDLAQSGAQLAAARAQLASAQGSLNAGAARYAALVGHGPADLAPEGALPGLPAGLDQAFAAADAESPVLRRAQFAEQAARFRLAEARAAKRPSASADLSVGYVGAAAPLRTDRFDRAITGTLTLVQPLYSGGVLSSRIRQAQERDTAARLASESARRDVAQSVAQAWSGLDVAGAALLADAEQVDAARLAFEGLQEQNRLGVATTLDLLIQQQQYRDARLGLIQARRDRGVAQAAVLAAVGRLSIARLAPGTAPYDPARAFDRADRAGRFPLEVVPSLFDRLGAPRS